VAMCGAGASVTPASRGGGSCGPPPAATTRAWSGCSLPPLAYRKQQTASIANTFYTVGEPQMPTAAEAAAQVVHPSAVGCSAAPGVCVIMLTRQDTKLAAGHSSCCVVC
jgi:hypothetical protein